MVRPGRHRTMMVPADQLPPSPPEDASLLPANMSNTEALPLREDPKEPIPEPEPPPPAPPPVVVAIDPAQLKKLLARYGLPERHADSWSVWRAGVTDQAVRVASQQLRRRSLLIVNLGDPAIPDPTVYVGRDSGLATGAASIPLKAGADFTLTNTGEAWGICATGQTAQVAVVSEFDNEIPELD